MSCPGFRRGHECSKGKEEYHHLLVEFIELNMHYMDKSNPNRIVYCFALEQNGEREPVILRVQSSYLLNKYENFMTFDHAISDWYANYNVIEHYFKTSTRYNIDHVGDFRDYCTYGYICAYFSKETVNSA